MLKENRAALKLILVQIGVGALTVGAPITGEDTALRRSIRRDANIGKAIFGHGVVQFVLTFMAEVCPRTDGAVRILFFVVASIGIEKAPVNSSHAFDINIC